MSVAANKRASLRIGVIGAGEISFGTHFPILKKLSEEGLCELVIVCDLNFEAAQRAQREYSFATATHDANDILEGEDIDALYILGPAAIHYEYGMRALENGKHIFVEKPPAPNTSALREMVALAESKGLIAVAGFNRRFEHPLREIKRRIGSGETVTTAEVVFHKPALNIAPPYGMKSWLGANGIHTLDVVRFLIDERPEFIFAARKMSGEVPADTSALLVWRDGRHALFSTNHDVSVRLERYTVHVRGATLEAESRKFTMRSADGEESASYVGDLETRGYVEESRAFFRAIATGEEPQHSLRRVFDSLYLVELIEAEYRGIIEWPDLTARGAVRPEKNINRPDKKQQKKRLGKSVLVLNPSFMKVELPLLAEHFKLVYEEELPNLSDAERRMVGAALGGGSGAKPLTLEMVQVLPNLSVFAVAGGSIRRAGGEVAIAAGIPVINTADVFAKTVAEFILMQALIGLRMASRSHDAMRAGGWGFERRQPLGDRMIGSARRLAASLLPEPLKETLKPYFGFARAKLRKRQMGKNLRGRTVGLLGFGELTKELIPLLRAHGCRTLVYSEYLSQEQAAEWKVEKVEMGQAITAEVVILLRGLSEKTRHFFGLAEMEALLPGAVFINTARAGLINTEALLKRLRRGDIFACLDVFDEEPLPANHELRTMSNVFLTSHLAGATDQMYTEARRAVIEKLGAYMNGSNIPGIITTKEKFDNMT